MSHPIYSDTAILQNRFSELLATKERLEGRIISILEVERETGVNRMTLHSYQYNRIMRYDSRVVLSLCRYFGVGFDEFLVVNEKTTVNAPA